MRQARSSDAPALFEPTARIHSPEWGHSAEILSAQQTRVSAGQFVTGYRCDPYETRGTRNPEDKP